MGGGLARFRFDKDDVVPLAVAAVVFLATLPARFVVTPDVLDRVDLALLLRFAGVAFFFAAEDGAMVIYNKRLWNDNDSYSLIVKNALSIIPRKNEQFCLLDTFVLALLRSSI